MHSEMYCDSLESLDRVAAIRALHQAFLQLCAARNMGETFLDHAPALDAIAACMAQAGHVAFKAS